MKQTKYFQFTFALTGIQFFLNATQFTTLVFPASVARPGQFEQRAYKGGIDAAKLGVPNVGESKLLAQGFESQNYIVSDAKL
jgi:tRNA U34 5-carboxymethylaminomethyl modifying GTPase MnmE/TrmE